MTGQARAALAIAAGGTGGHIYPALAVAQALQQHARSLDILFLCGRGEVELDIYRRAGIEPAALPIGRSGRGLRGRCSTIRQVWAARRVALKILGERRPFALLGMGGYVAFGPVWAAKTLKIPIILHEQNSVLGRAQRMAARWAKTLACSYPETLECVTGIPAVLTGNPIRRGFDSADNAAARRFFDIEPKARCLFISGGSQGARGINRLVLESLTPLGQWAEANRLALALIWACGPREFPRLRRALDPQSTSGLSVRLFDFIERVDLAYAAADLVVGRAGAGTVAEVAAAGKPAIFVPFPGAIHDHQRRNAQSVVQRGGGRLVEEQTTSPEAFCRILEELLADPERLRRMAEASRRGGRPHAAEELARLILTFCPGAAADFSSP